MVENSPNPSTAIHMVTYDIHQKLHTICIPYIL